MTINSRRRLPFNILNSESALFVSIDRSHDNSKLNMCDRNDQSYFYHRPQRRFQNIYFERQNHQRAKNRLLSALKRHI